MKLWIGLTTVGLLALAVGGGCAYAPQPPMSAGPLPVPASCENPISVAGVPRDLLWEQIVDVVDDYFEIREEVRVRQAGDVITEGYLQTHFQDGATLFEPHRGDSVGRYNRWEATLQSIRRYALVRVIPTQGALLVEVNVFKEVENVERPEHATAGAASFAGASQLEAEFQPESFPLEAASPGRANASDWIPLGRDPPLEQQMLAQLQARLGLMPR